MGEPEPPAGPPAWRRRLVQVARLGVVAVVGFFIVYWTARSWTDVRTAFAALSWTSLILAGLAALGAIIVTMLSWRAVVTDLGHELPVAAAGQINLVGQLGKYVPGSVWAYLLQMELARRHGVPRARGFLASLVATMLGITAGVLIGTLGLRAMLDYAGTEAETRTIRWVFYVSLVLVPVVVAYAHPRVLNRLVGVALRLTRRPPLDRPVSWRGVTRSLGWSVTGYLLCGLHLWLLAGSVAPAARTVEGLLVCVGAFALAMIAGTFFVIAPAGLGVRDVVVVAALAGAGIIDSDSSGLALGVALASRLLFTVADLIAAGAAALVALNRGVRPDQPSHATP